MILGSLVRPPCSISHATQHNWVSQCSWSRSLNSTWWCSLHCRHTFWLQLCIIMLHTYTPTKTSTANQMALQQAPAENQITCTAMARNETFLLQCRGSRQLRARLAHLPSYPAHHSVLYLQHLSTAFLMTLHAGVWTSPALLPLFIVFNSIYTPNRLFSRDSWGLGWCFDISTNAYFSTSVLLLGWKTPCRSCQPKEISVFSAMESNWFFLHWQLFKLNLGSQGNEYWILFGWDYGLLPIHA